MSDVARTMAQMTGFFKTTYLDKKDVRNVLPEVAKIQEDIAFSGKNKMGTKLAFPVLLSYEQGFTHFAADEDILTLNDALSASSKEAQVDAQQIMLKSLLSYKAAARSLSDQQSFERETKHLVENMVTSFKKRVEFLCLYGKEGLGVIEAKTDDGSTCTVTITKASFGPLIWSGMEGCRVDVILANKTNFSNASARNVAISVVDIDTRKITLAADIESVINIGDHLYLAKTSEDAGGTFTSAGNREMPGIKYLLTYSGTLFNINNTQHKLWKGTEFSASGGSGTSLLSFNIAQRAVARGVSKGLDGTARLYVSHLQWADLMNDQAAARRLDQSYSGAKVENGSKVIAFHSQNGDIEIVSHGMIKGGDAFILQLTDWERVGSVEMSFTIPGRGDDIFKAIDNQNAYMIAIYSDQVIFCKRNAAQVYIKDLTYSDVDA